MEKSAAVDQQDIFLPRVQPCFEGIGRGSKRWACHKLNTWGRMSTRIFLAFKNRRQLKRRVNVRYCTFEVLARLNVPLVNKKSRRLQRRLLSADRRRLTADETATLVYTGPLGGTVRLLKLFSVTTAALTVTFTPILAVYGNPATPLAMRLGLSSIVLTVGVSTTLLLHWFMKSYVTRLYFDPKRGVVTAVTFDMIGRRKATEFHVSEARPPDRVATLSTFQANGRTYYIHTDIFEDVDLLQKLAGPLPIFSDQKY